MENNIDFEIIIEEDVPNYLIGDSLRIEQVLINLTSNGIKFTHDGRVTLHISKIAKDEYQFCISDTGIGMNEEQLKKIFEPFTQADDTTTRNYGGTGLGLTISKELVHLMGGEIWVTSEVGKGSQFCFFLPLKESREKEIKTIDEKERMVPYRVYPKKIHSIKKSISLSHEQEILKKLEEGLNAQRPNLCKPLINELENYYLQTMDIKKFEAIKSLVSRYRFKEALELLNE